MGEPTPLPPALPRRDHGAAGAKCSATKTVILRTVVLRDLLCVPKLVGSQGRSFRGYKRSSWRRALGLDAARPCCLVTALRQRIDGKSRVGDRSSAPLGTQNRRTKPLAPPCFPKLGS
jgi:hypothetical protein